MRCARCDRPLPRPLRGCEACAAARYLAIGDFGPLEDDRAERELEARELRAGDVADREIDEAHERASE